MIVCLVISCYPFFVETIYYAISSAILLLYIFPKILANQNKTKST
jgi:hypothetical protein